MIWCDKWECKLNLWWHTRTYQNCSVFWHLHMTLLTYLRWSRVYQVLGTSSDRGTLRSHIWEGPPTGGGDTCAVVQPIFIHTSSKNLSSVWISGGDNKRLSLNAKRKTPRNSLHSLLFPPSKKMSCFCTKNSFESCEGNNLHVNHLEAHDPACEMFVCDREIWTYWHGPYLHRLKPRTPFSHNYFHFGPLYLHIYHSQHIFYCLCGVDECMEDMYKLNANGFNHFFFLFTEFNFYYQSCSYILNG